MKNGESSEPCETGKISITNGNPKPKPTTPKPNK